MSATKEVLDGGVCKNQKLPFHLQELKSKAESWVVWVEMMMVPVFLLTMVTAFALALWTTHGRRMKINWNTNDVIGILLVTTYMYILFVPAFFSNLVSGTIDKKFYTNGRWPKLLWILTHNLVKQ